MGGTFFHCLIFNMLTPTLYSTNLLSSFQKELFDLRWVWPEENISMIDYSQDAKRPKQRNNVKSCMRKAHLQEQKPENSIWSFVITLQIRENMEEYMSAPESK